MVVRQLCLTGLCAALVASAARLPPTTQQDEFCAQQALYQAATEPGSVVIEDGNFAFVPHANGEFKQRCGPHTRSTKQSGCSIAILLLCWPSLACSSPAACPGRLRLLLLADSPHAAPCCS